MMKKKTLASYSECYYGKNAVYEHFSQVEDTPGLISEKLARLVQGRVLDAGCGSGKFTEVLLECSDNYIGIDIADAQLKIAKGKYPEEQFILSSLEHIPLASGSVDTAVACWVLGTILDEEKRGRAVNEIKRVLKKEGCCYIVDNDEGGEFEEIRGRIKGGQTRGYHQWLLQHGFTILEGFETYFVFKDKEEAKNIFEEIWGSQASARIQSERIRHKIIIFKFVK